MSFIRKIVGHDTRIKFLSKSWINASWSAERVSMYMILILASIFLLLSNQWVLIPSLPNWYDQQRFLALFVFAIALIRSAFFPPKHLPHLLSSMVIIALALSVASPIPGWALAETAVFMGMLATAFCVRAGYSSLMPTTASNLAITSLVVFGTTICLPPLMQTILAYTTGVHELRTASLFNGFSNHRFFSQAESMLIPLMALPAMMQNSKKQIRQVGNVIALLLWMYAFAAGTRAFYVAALTGTLFALVCFGKTGRQWVQYQTGFVLLGGILYALLFIATPYLLGINILTDNDRLGQFNTAFDSSGRLTMWHSAWSLIFEHPWTGIGPMHFATLATYEGDTPGFAAHPHNAVIQILVEWGLPFGTLMLGCLAYAFWRLRQTSISVLLSPEHKTLSAVMSITWIIVFVYSLLDGSLVTPYTQVLLSVLFGWSWAIGARGGYNLQYRQYALQNTITGGLLRIVYLTSGVFLVWMALTPYKVLTPHIENHARSYPNQGFWPRFWSQGLINLREDARYNNILFKSIPQQK